MRFLADENVDLDLVRAIRRSRPDLDLITSGEAGLLGALDPAVLDAAAALDRVLWTHDTRTMPAYVRDRVAAGRSTPGVIVVRTGTPFRRVIDDLLLVADCAIPSDLRDRVAYIPL